MGIIASRDTRRISFDNTFALSNSALAVIPKSIEDESTLGFDDLTPDTAGELICAEKPKYVEVQEEKEPDYWTQRIEDMKKEHQIINNIIEAEFDNFIESTNNAYEPPKVITHERILKVKPCYDWRSKVRTWRRKPTEEFGKLHQVFSSSMPQYLKTKVFNQCVVPVMTYGAETGKFTVRLDHKFKVAQRAIERAMLGVLLKDKISIEVVRQKTKVMQCYADNPLQPLVCSAYVQAFTKSVASCRAGD